MPSSTLLNITETDCVHMFAAAVVRPIAVSLAKKTELIAMPQICVGSRNHYWHHLANIIEHSVHGGIVALCQITLTACGFSDIKMCIVGVECSGETPAQSHALSRREIVCV